MMIIILMILGHHQYGISVAESQTFLRLRGETAVFAG